nr:proline-rich receptor-like protein kinase PERK2 [Aegilops tauschii subsp. strangulata]
MAVGIDPPLSTRATPRPLVQLPLLNHSSYSDPRRAAAATGSRPAAPPSTPSTRCRRSPPSTPAPLHPPSRPPPLPAPSTRRPIRRLYPPPPSIVAAVRPPSTEAPATPSTRRPVHLLLLLVTWPRPWLRRTPAPSRPSSAAGEHREGLVRPRSTAHRRPLRHHLRHHVPRRSPTAPLGELPRHRAASPAAALLPCRCCLAPVLLLCC